MKVRHDGPTWTYDYLTLVSYYLGLEDRSTTIDLEVQRLESEAAVS